jgi:hypothetical protein
MRTIHIAGFPVRIGPHCRQLCAWCGEKLVDANFDLVMVAPISEVTPDFIPGFWEMGALVAVDRSEETRAALSTLVSHAEGDPLPAGSCFRREHPSIRLVPQ